MTWRRCCARSPCERAAAAGLLPNEAAGKYRRRSVGLDSVIGLCVNKSEFCARDLRAKVSELSFSKVASIARCCLRHRLAAYLGRMNAQ